MTDTQQSMCVINEDKTVDHDNNVTISDEEKSVDHDNTARIDKDKPVPVPAPVPVPVSVGCDWRLEEGAGGPTERTWASETVAFDANEDENEAPTLLDRLPYVFGTIIVALILTGFVLTYKL